MTTSEQQPATGGSNSAGGSKHVAAESQGSSSVSSHGDRVDILRAVAEASGAELLSARRISAEANSEGFITGHDVEFRTAHGTERHTVYVENTSGPLREGSGTVRLRETTGEEVDVWLYPRDPRLPALPTVVFPDAASVIIERLGIHATDVSLSLLTYRPGKRAVVRMDTATSRIFIKIVRPEVVDTLHALHNSWLDHGVPVPRTLAKSSDGLIALETLPGVEAMRCISTLSDPELLVAAVDSLCSLIATIDSTHRARASLITRLRWYERRVGALPRANARAIRHARRAIAARFDSAPQPERAVTIHGDLHLSQLFVDPESPATITGVLDIDTAGLGDPADDAAALWAHLIVTAEFTQAREDAAGAKAMRSLASAFHANWKTNRDPGFADRAAAIAATHLLGHVLSGSIAEQDVLGLIALALQDESVLTEPSPASHL